MEAVREVWYEGAVSLMVNEESPIGETVVVSTDVGGVGVVQSVGVVVISVPVDLFIAPC